MLVALALTGCDDSGAAHWQSTGAPGGIPSMSAPAQGSYVEGELLVRFRDDAPPSAMAMLDREWGARVVHTYRSLPGLSVLRMPEGTNLERALEAYRQDPRVLYAGRNSIYSIDSVPPPSDPLFGGLWGLSNTGQDTGVVGADIGALHAWESTTGSEGLALALIDSGMDYTHPDLLPNVWVNSQEIPGNSLDDDSNGYVDDVHGINAIANTGNPMDDNNHGTHVAGTMGAAGNNGLGVVGVNWNVKLIPCKFLDRAGNGTEANALKCMDYLLALKTRAQDPVNIVASNNSWSCRARSCESAIMREAIQRHMNAGMLFVAAAGNVNANIDTAEAWPAKYLLPNMLVVAATDRKDLRWNLSSFGRHTVHLAAPGVDIVSTVPGGAYRSFNGTSMATPHVTGVLGLLAAQEPTRGWKALKNLALAGAKPLSGLAANTVTGGRLRAWGPSNNGALNCVNQHLSRRLLPVVSSPRLSAVVGRPVPLSVLNINCALPAGNTSVTVSGLVERSIPLVDDGTHGDVLAEDGIYTGQFNPARPGSYTLTFPGGEQLPVDVMSDYAPAEQLPFAYETMTEENVRVEGASDETTSIINAPFPLPVADLSPGISRLYVNSNGYITFSPVQSAAANEPLPSRFFPAAIAPLWQNLEVPGTAPSGLYYETLGTAPHRKFVIEWRDVAVFPVFPNFPLKFQVVFFEDSSDIVFNYASVFYGVEEFPELDNGGSATVGIQLLPEVASQFSHMTPSLSNNMSLRFRTLPPPNVPVATAPAIQTEQPREGSPVLVTSSFHEPNLEDGPWRVEWSCHHQGDTFVPEQEQSYSYQGLILTHCLYSADGTYTVAVRVTGQSGEASQVQSTSVTVADVNPRILSFTSTLPGGTEPVRIGFDVVATTGAEDGSADAIVEYRWDFDGNGSIDAVTTQPHAEHLYANNPASGNTFAVQVEVWDSDSSSKRTLPVTVSNVSPELNPLPYGQVATKGIPYKLALDVSDPGSADTLSFTLVNAPSGMTIRSTGARTGLLEWTPTGDQCSTGDGTLYMVTVQVSDGDGGHDSELLEIRAIRKGGDKPSIPGIISPIMGELIDAISPLLTVRNVSHEEAVPPEAQPLRAAGCSMLPEGAAPVQGLLLLALAGMLRRRTSC